MCGWIPQVLVQNAHLNPAATFWAIEILSFSFCYTSGSQSVIVMPRDTARDSAGCWETPDALQRDHSVKPPNSGRRLSAANRAPQTMHWEKSARQPWPLTAILRLMLCLWTQKFSEWGDVIMSCVYFFQCRLSCQFLPVSECVAAAGSVQTALQQLNHTNNSKQKTPHQTQSLGPPP